MCGIQNCGGGNTFCLCPGLEIAKITKSQTSYYKFPGADNTEVIRERSTPSEHLIMVTVNVTDPKALVFTSLFLPVPFLLRAQGLGVNQFYALVLRYCPHLHTGRLPS